MGWTHYWARPSELAADPFLAAALDVKRLLAALAIPVGGFRVFQFNSSLYAPLWRTSIIDGRLRHYGGPVVSVGARKSLDDVDGGDFVDHRAYGGLRETISPEHDYEIHRGGMQGRRIDPQAPDDPVLGRERASSAGNTRQA